MNEPGGKLAISGDRITYISPVGETRMVANQEGAKQLLYLIGERLHQQDARYAALATQLKTEILMHEQKIDKALAIASKGLDYQQEVILAQQETINKLVEQKSQTESKPETTTNVTVELWGYDHNIQALATWVFVVVFVTSLGLLFAAGRQPQQVQPVQSATIGMIGGAR